VLILGIIVFGMGIGWIAQLILGRTRPGRRNWGQALAAGLIGSFVGGLLVSLIMGDGLELRASGIIGSIVGAVIVVLVWDRVAGRTRA
jgi:uncharacterized membrane protein YeaQ/YmgE (transglycosylase-associated protein family)